MGYVEVLPDPADEVAALLDPDAVLVLVGAFVSETCRGTEGESRRRRVPLGDPPLCA